MNKKRSLFKKLWKSMLALPLLPSQESTWVSACNAEQLLEQLEKSLYQPQLRRDPLADVSFRFSPKQERQPFCGFMGADNSFCIYPTPYYPEYFIPLIYGRIEGSSVGSIIFLRYKLFPGTLFFILLMGFMIGCLVCVFLFLLPNFLYLSFTFLGGFLLYWLILLSFRHKVKQSENLLLALLAVREETL